MRCTQCQKYGHWHNNCRGPTRCDNCGQMHDESPCPNLTSCYNCQRSHQASDPNCPRYRQEKDIILLSYEKDIPFSFARDLFRDGTRPNNPSPKPSRDPSVFNNPYTSSVEVQMNSLRTDFNIKDDTLEDKTLPLENSDTIL